MENLYNNAALLWFVAGFVLLLLEFVLPGLILFFFGVGAWIVGLICLFVDISIDMQLIIFAGASILTLLLFRKSVKKLLWSRKKASEIEDELIGRSGIAQTYIGPGTDGKIDFKGTSWDARSEDIIEVGQKVIIIGNDSILLIVQKYTAL